MNDKFKIVNNVKDFIKNIDKIIINYPRSEFNLKNRIENTSYDLLELIYLGNSCEDKDYIQRQIVSKISMLDFYIEISYDKKCISLKKLNLLSSKLDIIRKMIYGWIKSESKL